MKKQTKYIVGLSLICSALVSTITFISLLFKKKSAWKAFFALTAVGGVVGVVLLKDKILPLLPFKKKETESETEPVDEVADQEQSTENEDSTCADDEAADAEPCADCAAPVEESDEEDSL